ncbi:MULTISPECIES: hypothetical protein [Methylosinus]|uniref:Glycosyltransferase RgtA/B/C/D-like domain-containing protein n=1 Tax=Methylosinus trichosporium (strain ATCC 35070 / NCIMB 11131 / UNIQEM 75 / OB3b) TaxID=595536 RepID=A0A2D2D096_METT3|nr:MULTISPECIES: hypothetical protein [Methylosinus]ATQ68392.1 hypothetical protein CQW49_11245 [Methylosinus trichosporium OB3b]OBS51368.1 hypothetical protein A8B73_16960 [Methylosinus sp. 3S-1]
MNTLEKGRTIVRSGPAAPDPLARALGSPWLGAGLAVAAIAAQLAGHIDCDVSWFLTFAEKFVDGATPYVDVTDPNPPASFLSLVPAVLLARALHVAPEACVATMALVFAAGTIWLAFRLLRLGAARSRRASMLLLNALVFLLIFAPALAFAEREHIAVLAMLPLLAALSVEQRRPAPARAARILAGLGGGLAIALKPHFALAIALPALAIAWRERRVSALWRDELIAAALGAAAYAIAVVLLFPAYVERALPLALEVYGPSRDGLAHLLTHSLAPAYLALLAGFLVAARGALDRATLVFLLASIGGFAAFLIQGKGWINHAYPALALILIAWTLLAGGRERTPRRAALVKFLLVPALVGAPFCFGLADVIADAEEHPGLMEAAASAAPPHPRVATIARQLDFGHPLVRRLEGEWIGRQNALWVTALVGRLLPSATPERQARLEAWRHADLSDFAEDVRAGRPDIVVVEDEATRRFVLGRPETAATLDGYRLAERTGDIEIWRRAEQTVSPQSENASIMTAQSRSEEERRP